MNTQKLSTLILAIFLCGCGGGGGSGGGSVNGVPTFGVSGFAIDGYIGNALVFLDLNKNGNFDIGEPNTTSRSDGSFLLQATEIQIKNAPIVVQAIAGQSTDTDYPGVTIDKSYKLIAPPGSTVVTPLSTSLYYQMLSTGANKIDAIAQIQNLLNLSGVDITKDYINFGFTDAHKIAAAIVPVLQGIHLLKNSSPDENSPTYDQNLIANYVKGFLSEKSQSIINSPSPAFAKQTLASQIFVNSLTLSCASAPSLTYGAISENNAVFAIDNINTPPDVVLQSQGIWGQVFTVPSNLLGRLRQVQFFVRNLGSDNPSSYFKVELYAWDGSKPMGSPVYVSDKYYFIYPNLNSPSNFGTRPVVFNVDANLTPGSQYVFRLFGDATVGIDTISTIIPGNTLAQGYPTVNDWINWSGSGTSTKNLRVDYCFD